MKLFIRPTNSAEAADMHRNGDLTDYEFVAYICVSAGVEGVGNALSGLSEPEKALVVIWLPVLEESNGKMAVNLTSNQTAPVGLRLLLDFFGVPRA